MKNVRHIGIVVGDIKKSLAFYRDLLGLKIKKDMLEKSVYIDTILGLKKVNVRTIKLSAGDGSLVELLYYHYPVSRRNKRRKINDIGYAHIAFTTKDVDRQYLRLSKKGIVFNSPPQDSVDGYARVAFCRDPEDNFIELVEVLEKK